MAHGPSHQPFLSINPFFLTLTLHIPHPTLPLPCHSQLEVTNVNTMQSVSVAAQNGVEKYIKSRNDGLRLLLAQKFARYREQSPFFFPVTPLPVPTPRLIALHRSPHLPYSPSFPLPLL